MTISFEQEIELAIKHFASIYDVLSQKKPSFFHSIRVCSLLYSLGYGRNICLGGLLHDTLEDTSLTDQNINEQFGWEVGAIVVANTKNKNLPKEQVLLDIIDRCTMVGRDALIVKLADAYDNFIYYSRLVQNGELKEKEIDRAVFIAKHTLERMGIYSQNDALAQMVLQNIPSLCAN